MSKWADVIMVLVPDTTAATVYKDAIEAESRAGQDADVRARLQHPASARSARDADIDVAMVAPQVAGAPRPRAVCRKAPARRR